MAKFVCLLVVLALVEASLALKCYTCGQNSGKSCDKLDDSLLQQCGSVVNREVFCVKIVSKDDKVEKKCDSFPKDKKVECVKENDVTTCACNTDGCNSAPTLKLSSFAAVGLVIAFLVPKFFVH